MENSKSWHQNNKEVPVVQQMSEGGKNNCFNSLAKQYEEIRIFCVNNSKWTVPLNIIIITILIIIVIILVSVSGKNKEIMFCEKFDYDFYLLALQYKPGVCHNNKFCESPDINKKSEWTLHGLWPSKQKGQGPFDCLNETLNYSFFSENLNSQLSLNWPSLLSSNTDYGFQNHEWMKHGTCFNVCQYKVEKNKHQSFYMQTALDLREKYNPSKFFPSNNGSISMEELKKAFQENLGINVQLICNKGKEIRPYLIEIRIYLNLTTFQPITIDRAQDYNSSSCITQDFIVLYK
jgi:ribonuclease I